MALACFKTYDIRGKLDVDLNEKIAYRIGRAFARQLQAKSVVIGGDSRLSTPAIKDAVAEGLLDEGADVVDLGLTGTEEIYFASFFLDVDGGIEITASHNPIDYNGMKFIKRGGLPVGKESGLDAIHALAESGEFEDTLLRGKRTETSVLNKYCEHLLGFVDASTFKPLKLLVNAGNGAAGHVIDCLEAFFSTKSIPVQFIKINHEADGRFPQGIPNPLLLQNRQITSDAVIAHGADMGIAWDGDFDRCFFFDEKGQFIEGYYLVGLLAKAFLLKNPGEKIIYDPRLTWNTMDLVENYKGLPIESKTGHVFIKEKMRLENAIYGGEMSAHHYFRDFAYCDSGMIPWLLVCELLSQTTANLSDLIADRIALFPCSGEMNFEVKDASATLEKIKAFYCQSGESPPEISSVDGLSLCFSQWRMNIRSSNTEPFIRLNIETRGDKVLLKEKVDEVTALID